MPDRLVLDAHAVLTLLEDEPGADALEQALSTGDPWMTLVNLGEVCYMIERRYGAVEADHVWQSLGSDEPADGRVAIRWVPVDETLVRGAARLKAAGGMSYADCFTAAAAELLGCPVLTGDREFVAAERAGIAVRWLHAAG